jgi:hypothetical protein
MHTLQQWEWYSFLLGGKVQINQRQKVQEKEWKVCRLFGRWEIHTLQARKGRKEGQSTHELRMNQSRIPFDQNGLRSPFLCPRQVLHRFLEPRSSPNRAQIEPNWLWIDCYGIWSPNAARLAMTRSLWFLEPKCSPIGCESIVMVFGAQMQPDWLWIDCYGFWSPNAAQLAMNRSFWFLEPKCSPIGYVSML